MSNNQNSFRIKNGLAVGNQNVIDANGNVTIQFGGTVSFGSNAQYQRAGTMWLNQDFVDGNVSASTLVTGDLYYDGAADSIYIWTRFDDGHFDFKDVTVK